MKYKVETRRDNINKRTVFIPQPAGGQTIDVKEISRRIEGMCTVTKADVAAVLEALESVIGSALAEGDSVRLGTLGSFRVKMRATSAESSEAVTASNITNVGVSFRATHELKQRLTSSEFERVDSAKD